MFALHGYFWFFQLKCVYFALLNKNNKGCNAVPGITNRHHPLLKSSNPLVWYLARPPHKWQEFTYYTQFVVGLHAHIIQIVFPTPETTGLVGVLTIANSSWHEKGHGF